MQQEIRYCELDGRRIAYATVGEGPVLLFGGRWISHLEEDWSDPDARAFFEDLAQTHRVVRYDRLGVGISDRGSHDVSDVSQLGRSSMRAAAGRRRSSAARAPGSQWRASRATSPSG